MMNTRTSTLLLAAAAACLLLSPAHLGVSALNLAPSFTADMNQHTITENTPVDSVIYRYVRILSNPAETSFSS